MQRSAMATLKAGLLYWKLAIFRVSGKALAAMVMSAAQALNGLEWSAFNPTQNKPTPRCWPCWLKWMRANPHLWPHWKGGRVRNQDGYIWVFARDHPNRNKYSNKVAEHRLVMEQQLGRLLRSDEHVHHLNGIKDDNRPENLVLTNTREHVRKYHHPGPRHCKMCGKEGQMRRGYCYTHYERWRAVGFAGDGPAPDKLKSKRAEGTPASHSDKAVCQRGTHEP